MWRLIRPGGVPAATVAVALTAALAGAPDPTAAAVAPDTTASAVTPDATAEAVPLDLPSVELLTPAVADAGARPTFSWEPVPGAATYALAVVTSAGGPVWAWEGTAMTVILGGWSEPPADGIPGPLITVECEWFVVAFAGDGSAMALSAWRPVSP